MAENSALEGGDVSSNDPGAVWLKMAQDANQRSTT